MTGGGGPKADLLKKMIAEEGLQGRVEMVGAVPHEKARDLLVPPPPPLPLFGCHSCSVCCYLCRGIRCVLLLTIQLAEIANSFAHVVLT